jgi:hypothetical protein
MLVNRLEGKCQNVLVFSSLLLFRTGICHMLYILRSVVSYSSAVLENIPNGAQADTPATAETTDYSQQQSGISNWRSF